MFTECPECSIGFRVTAKVLAQAGGRVRCGGCGNAFSALEHLTEELPATNEQDGTSSSEEDKFKETSRQLLKTLDELAGPDDVVIEDTGMEWRVLDEPEDDGQDDAEVEVNGGSEDLLTLEDDAQEPPDEQTFDGNTPLQDDEEITATAVTAESEKDVAADAGIDQHEKDVAADAGIDQHEKDVAADAASTKAAEEDEEEQADLALDEPEEWSELLEEEDDAADDMPLEVEEELAAIHNELSAKEDSAPVDLGAQFEMQAEAMGIDITGSQETVDEETQIADTEEKDSTGAGPLDEDEDEDEATESSGAGPLDEDEDEDEATESSGDLEQHIDVAAKAVEVGKQEEEMSDGEAIAAEQDRELNEMIHLSLADSAGDTEEESEPAAAEPAAAPEHAAGDEVPEQSDEEMTINQQIDQELLAAAAKDQDLRATIIGLEDPGDVFDENSPDVETIIMEGDVVRGAMEREREKEKRERALVYPVKRSVTY